MADEVKPPYVFFETRSIEDREATIATGHYVGKDIVFAIVTPAGTRDRIERDAEEWLKNVEEGVKQERIPADWLRIYRGALKDFRESRETPEFGVPIVDWPGASPAQIKLLLDINVRTLEDLSVANEETVSRIGMGGRALKQKAQAWLETAQGPGKVASELEALRVEIQTLRARDEARELELTKLRAKEAPAEEDA